MKRKLNILCALVMIVLGVYVSQSLVYSSGPFIDGIREGWKTAETNTEFKMEGNTMFGVALMPNNYAKTTDSIYNEKSGKHVPAHNHGMVIILDEESDSPYALQFIFYLLTQIAVILSIIWFIRIVTRVNKSYIFCWDNVRLLRQLGWILVAGFLCSLVNIIADAKTIEQLFSTPGYKLLLYNEVSYITLILGIISLIVAEAFAMGLRLQEEQDLTI